MKSLALFTVALVSTLTSAVTGVAHADETNEEKKDRLLKELSQFDSSVWYLNNEDGLDGLRLDKPASTCTDLIAELKALGVGPTEPVYSWPKEFPFRKAQEKCEVFAKMKTLTGAFDAIRKARDGNSRISGMKPGDAGATMWSEDVAARGKACVDAINDVEAKGGAMDVVIRSTEPQMTATQTRPWCQDLAKRAAALAGDSTKADAARKKAAHDRYAKFGAKGDKLAWLLKYDEDGKGAYWSMPPRCDRTDDPKMLAKSKSLIQWYENADGTHTLRKLTFKGNKLVKDQSKDFLTRAKAYSFCK